MRKKFFVFIIAVFTLFSFACANQTPSSMPNPNQSQNPKSAISDFDFSDNAKVTYCIIGFFPASYNVYIFTEQSFYHYDYTYYWTDSKDGFDYFKESLPDNEQYLVAEGSMPEDTWNSIKKALTVNKFKKSPEDLSVDDIDDGAIYEVEVLDDPNRFFSGGYMAGYGTGNKQKNFAELRTVLNEAVSECKDALKNAPLGTENSDGSNSTETPPQTPEDESNIPSYNVFADIPDHKGIYDYYSSDGSVFIRQDLNTHKSYINDNGNWIDFNDIYELATGAYGPRIEKFDYDGDGEEDYLIAECEGNGTGFSVYGLVVFKEGEDSGKFKNYDYSYFVNMIDEYIDYNYDEKTNALEVYEILPSDNDGYNGCSVTLDSNLTFEKIIYSDIIEISFENDKIYLTAPIGCIYSEYMAPDYDNSILVKAELTIDDDLNITPVWSIEVEE